MTKHGSADDLLRRLRIKPDKRVQLSEGRADSVLGWEQKHAEELLIANRERLEKLQYKLYADGRFALLVVLQAMDAGGKDGVLRHVMTAFNPQGCTVTSFKAPSSDELRHDYLWRVHQHVPRRGEVGVFNRSHYEDVLIVRVNELVPRREWKQRYDQINDFERMLSANHVSVVKIFLHISKGEQRRRFEDRLREPDKQWKFNPGDLPVRKQWDQYRHAYEDALRRCNTKWAPWYWVPSDHKWFRNLAVSEILCDALESLPLRYPRPDYNPARVRIT
jgi:PPK2 family polyphosphate:nucleotide phosphotransferase